MPSPAAELPSLLQTEHYNDMIHIMIMSFNNKQKLLIQFLADQYITLTVWVNIFSYIKTLTWVLFYASSDQHHFWNTRLLATAHSHLWNGLKKYSMGKKERKTYDFIFRHKKQTIFFSRILYTNQACPTNKMWFAC